VKSKEDNKVLLQQDASSKPSACRKDLETLLDEKVKALEESEERYKALYEFAPDMYASVDPKTRQILYCNETLVKSLGFESKAEIIGKDIMTLYHHDECSAVESSLANLQEKGFVENVERKLKKKNGDLIPVILKARAICDENGNVLYSISSLRDISNQKKLEHVEKCYYESERLFKASEKSHQTILNSVTDGWWDWNLETDDVYLSPCYKAAFGYKDNEMKSGPDSWRSIIFPEDLERVERTLREHIESGGERPYIVEERCRHKDGSTVWIVCRGQAIKDEDGKLRRMVGTQTVVTNLKNAERQLSIMAHQDSLTKLPNRISFMNHLLQAIEGTKIKGKLFAVLFIDVDNFKIINDTLGHNAGDIILCDVVQRLNQCARKSDFIARLGGDEFGIIVEGVKCEIEVEEISRRYIEKLQKTFSYNREKVLATISVGVAMYPCAGQSPEELLKNADIAMYRAKDQGKNSLVIFDDKIKKEVRRVNLIESELRTAIQESTLDVYYQPQFDCDDNKLVGVEALIRWSHPSMGEVEPNEFVKIAESGQLIVVLDAWVLKKAISDFVQLCNKLKCNELMLSINISMIQLNNRKFIDLIKAELDKGFQAKQLVLELTETSLMDSLTQAEDMLRELSELGVKIALDDFGVGYSSMQHLKYLPISFLKIDRSFVGDIESDGNSMAIVNAIISLAKSLGLTCIAEGVETAAQLNYLKKAQCNQVQGFYLSKALSVNDLMDFYEMQSVVV
jgi:diguanylate cyclase (GGDEF)-like protein/PAS domain S-box-containing protein